VAITGARTARSVEKCILRLIDVSEESRDSGLLGFRDDECSCVFDGSSGLLSCFISLLSLVVDA
jgi:hypothetical protein